MAIDTQTVRVLAVLGYVVQGSDLIVPGTETPTWGSPPPRGTTGSQQTPEARVKRLDELKASYLHPRIGQPLIELGAEPMLAQAAPVDFRVELALPRVVLHVSI